MKKRPNLDEAIEEIQKTINKYNNGLLRYVHVGTLTNILYVLKEQEAVPVGNGKCPSCNWDFENGELDFSNINESRFYCPRCGQAVKWE